MVCDDYNEGKRCSACLTRHIDVREVKIAHAVSTSLKNIGIKPGSFAFRSVYRGMGLGKRVLGLIRRLTGRSLPEGLMPPRSASHGARAGKSINSVYATRVLGEVYRQYRRRNLSCVNTLFDRVLVVSNRVREIALDYGIAQERVEQLYIGSRFAENRIPLRVCDHDYLKIAYLGYERRDKGFYHFVEALEAMPRSAARKISVLIGAKLGSPLTLERLQRLAVEFRDFEIVDGYEHGALDKLLEDVDLGIVPVLWEDNLPQVAIEFVAHGVAVLSSDLGGAKELCGANPKFVYRNGNVDDFINKILYFLDHREALATYGDHALDLMDMERHVSIMVDRVYKAPVVPVRAPEERPGAAGYDRARVTA
jgi:glycosyltransferase involved in cell wall biosynthesis